MRTFKIIEGTAKEVEKKLNEFKETSFINILSSCCVEGLLVLTTVITPLNSTDKSKKDE